MKVFGAKAFMWVASCVFVLDQWSKYWAVGRLTDAFNGLLPEQGWMVFIQQFFAVRHPHAASTVSVIPDFWHFRYVENPGAAWGFLATAPEWFRGPFFSVISVVAVVFIIGYFRKLEPQQTLLRVALALVFGGALGNCFDRFRMGYVIDFIDWHWYNKATWPTFNVADAAISVGVGLMVLDMLLHPQPQQKTKEA
jgi:signal peptidase II